MKHAIDPRLVICRSASSIYTTITGIIVLTIIGLFSLVSVAQAQTAFVSVNETTCPEFGEWGGKTCVLQQDVNHPLVIDEPGVFLDGNGHSIVVDDATAEAALLITSEKNKITNLVITSVAQTGIQISSSARRTVVEGVIILGANVGVQDSGQETQLNHLYIDGLGRAEAGIKIEGPVNLVVTLTVIKNVETGIVASSTSRVTVAQTLIDSVATGMSVTASEDITLTHSRLQNVTETGVYINASNRVTVEKSYLSGVASVGVHVQSIPDLDRVFIIGNSISDVSTGLLDTTPISQYEGQTKPRLFFRRNDVVEVGVTHTVPSVAQNLVQFTPNYWSDYDQDSEGCLDDNADDTCDAGYQRPAVDDVEYVISGVSHRVPFGDAADLAIPTCELVGPDSALVAESVSFDLVSDQTNQGFITRFGAFETSPDQADILFSSAGEFEITAYAWGTLTVPTRCATTVTVTDESPQPVGASSVLFLPGIQASRLYADGLLGTEDRLWEPQGNGDVRQLAMTSAGESVNAVYTRDVVEEITGLFVGKNIYKGFLGLLEDLQDDQIIADYEPFAYDWRKSVFEVATKPVLYPDDETKRLLDEVLRLAKDSYTGKVTIISHSNGGLVAKALLHEYGTAELAGKVDKLVMIGAPQLGTPKGIGAMLHGTDQQALGGLVIDDEVARDVIQNMPGAYTLLPSSAYFSSVSSDSLIFADDSIETESVREYGSITNRAALEDFLLDTKNVLPDDLVINQPLTLNKVLLESAKLEQDILDTWQAPDGVEVYEAVGTGLATISGFEYRAFTCSTSAACLFGTFMKPYPLFSNRGDQTVIAESALGYEGDKVTAVFDLKEEGEERLILQREHADLTESPAVQTFVESVLKYPYVADVVEVPEFAEVISTYTLIGVHSPVTVQIITTDNKVVGRTGDEQQEELIGSQYIELGGSTYLIIPSEVNDYTIQITGTDIGPFTLTIEQLGSDNERTTIASIVSESAPNMQATMFVAEGVHGNLMVDIDADGSIDEERTISGELVVTEMPVTTEGTNNQSDSSTRVGGRAPRAQVLGITTSQDEQISSIIIADALEQLSQVLQTRDYLTELESQNLIQLLQAIRQSLAINN